MNPMNPIKSKMQFEQIKKDLDSDKDSSIISYDKDATGFLRPIVKKESTAQVYWLVGRVKPENERAAKVGNFLKKFFLENVTPDTLEIRLEILNEYKSRLIKHPKVGSTEKSNPLIQTIQTIIDKIISDMNKIDYELREKQAQERAKAVEERLNRLLPSSDSTPDAQKQVGLSKPKVKQSEEAQVKQAEAQVKHTEAQVKQKLEQPPSPIPLTPSLRPLPSTTSSPPPSFDIPIAPDIPRRKRYEVNIAKIKEQIEKLNELGHQDYQPIEKVISKFKNILSQDVQKWSELLRKLDVLLVQTQPPLSNECKEIVRILRSNLNQMIQSEIKINK